MTVQLITTQRLEFLILKGGCIGSSDSTLVKMPHCWKSRATAQISVLQLVAPIPLSLFDQGG